MTKNTPQASPLAGRWRITEMDHWDRDAIDLLAPAFIELTEGSHGQFAFIVVRGWLDCRPVERDGRPGVEFSWDGDDEGDQVNGRGWAALTHDGMLEGHIYFHQGMDSGFDAKPYACAGTGDGQ
ncbi:hypothetical protein ACX80E_10395 [Arthrobacter sp. TMN-49]